MNKEKFLLFDLKKCIGWTAFVVISLIPSFWAVQVHAQEAETGSAPPILVADASSGALKRLSLEQLMNLDVTSVDKKPEPFGLAPAAIDVITGDAIRRSGVTTLPEALRLADNLEVAQKNSHDWAISARGFNTDLSNKLLVLMDGRSIYTPLFSGVFWDIQDTLLNDLDRIEVISGPGGTLWGANAVNGVINITTKSAKDTQGVYWEEGTGPQWGSFANFRYGGSLAPDVFFRTYAKHISRDNEVLPDGTNALDEWRMDRAGFRVDALASPQETFTLQGDVYGGDQNIKTTGDALTHGGNALGRWTKNFSDDSSMSLQLYYDQTFLSDPIPADKTFAPAGILTDAMDTYDLDFQHRFHLNDWNNLIWGTGARITHDVVQNSPAVAFDPTVKDQGLFNLFLQDEITLDKPLQLTLGSKVEHNDYTGFEFEPSARVRWNPFEGHMLWAAVSRAVRMPSRVDRDERLPTPALKFLGINNLLTGGADFLSETEISYELGYRAQFAKVVSTSISGFFNNYDNIRSAALSPPPALLGFPVVFQNGLLAQTWGVEATADCQVLVGWTLHLGYDYLGETVWVKPGEADINKGLNEVADPKNQVFVRSSVDLPGGFELDPAFRFVDSLVYNNSGTAAILPSYAELDIRLGWRPIERLELSLVGENLLMDHHAEYVVSAPAPAEAIQRSFYGKAALQF